MNNLVKVNNKKLEIKEHEGKRVVTFKEIDLIHERADGTAGRNFRDNKKHFIKGVDYFEVSTKNVVSLESYGFSKFASSGIMITESGYLMLVKSFTDDLAWDVQRDLVNKYFRSANKDNVELLSPELQMFKLLFDTAVKQNSKQEEMDKRLYLLENNISYTKSSSSDIKDTSIKNSDVKDKDIRKLYSISDIAKEHNLLGKDLNLLLEGYGIQYQKRRHVWKFYAKYMEKSFRAKDKSGNYKWTQEGKEFIESIVF